MNILTQEQTKDFIKKLQGFNSQSEIKRSSLTILEPRFFDIILTELGSEKVLELDRVSDSCEQICQEKGIEYNSLYSPVFGQHHQNIEHWDGDIIAGLTSMNQAKRIALKGLQLLQSGHWFAMYQTYNFLESLSRYLSIFKETPFNKMYLTPARPLVSPDGHFSDINAIKNGAWFVWFKDTPVVNPEVEWIGDELFQKYFVHGEDGKMLKPDSFKRVYKKPIQVKIDTGRYKLDKK